MPATGPITVVETPEFLSAIRGLMTEAQRMTLVDYLAHNPTAGNLIKGQVASANYVGRWMGAEKAAAHA